MKYDFEELVDIELMQKLTDSLHAAFGLPSAIITAEGKILTGSGWQEICTKFHRMNPEAEKDCIESDKSLFERTGSGEKYVVYKCPRGLTDSASPVYIDGQHVANVFTGQFLDSESTEERDSFFKEQAAKFGFDEKAYMAAYRKVPVFSEGQHRKMLDVLVNIAEVVSQIGLTRKRELEKAAEAVESEKKYKLMIQNSPDITMVEAGGFPIYISPQIEDILGFKPEEFDEVKMPEQIHPDDVPSLIETKQKIYEGNDVLNVEYRCKTRNGEYKWISHTARAVRENDELTSVFSTIRDISNRKNAESELKDSEERFKALHNASFGGIAIHDMGVILECNQGLADISGYETEELTGMNGFVLISDDTREIVLSNIKAGYEKPYEAVGVRKNGEEYPVRLEARMIPYKGKQVRVVEFRDITDSKQIEKALQDSEETFRSFFENNQAIMLQVDPTTKQILKANKAAISYYGYTKQEMLSMTIDTINTLPIDEINLRMKKAMSEESNIFILEHKLANGELRDVEIYASPMKINDEMKMFIIIQDVTERKRTAEALQASEEKFREMAEMLPEAIFETDEKMKVTYANQRSIELFGYLKEDIENGLMIIDNIVPEDQERAISNIKRRINGEDLGAIEYRVLKKNGDILPVLHHMNPIYTEEKLTGFRAVIIDLTAIKKAEKELEKLAKLESLALLGGGIAHNFKNILASIMMNISLMKYKPEKISEYLIKMEKSVVQATALASRFQTFSAGGNPIIESVSVKDVIRDAIHIALSGSEMTHDLIYDKELQSVYGDSKQLCEVFMNLAINSKQAMPMGGNINIKGENLLLESENELGLNSGKYVKISFRDNGSGIDESKIKSIFDPFYTNKVEGTGLGLTTVQSIIHKHRGEIKVESELHKWTQFSIYLPASDKIVHSKTVEEPTIQQSAHKRILFMDDNDEIRELMEETGDLINYSIKGAKNGAETIELFKKAIETNMMYDAVILDLTIQGNEMQGEDVLCELKKMNPDVKAIVFSGHSTRSTVVDFRDHGFVAKLDKPVTIEKLSMVLNEVCES